MIPGSTHGHYTPSKIRGIVIIIAAMRVLQYALELRGSSGGQSRIAEQERGRRDSKRSGVYHGLERVVEYQVNEYKQ